MELRIPDETDWIKEYQHRKRVIAVRRLIKPLDQPKTYLMLGAALGAVLIGLGMFIWGLLGWLG